MWTAPPSCRSTFCAPLPRVSDVGASTSSALALWRTLAVWRASSGAQGLSAARPPTRIHSPTHLLSHRPDRSTAARFQTWPISTTSKRRSNDLTDSCWRSGPQPPLLPRAQQLAAPARATAAGGRGAEPGGPETCGDLDLTNRRRESPSSAVLLLLTCSTPHCLRNPTAAHIERRMKTLHGCTCTLQAAESV